MSTWSLVPARSLTAVAGWHADRSARRGSNALAQAEAGLVVAFSSP